MYKNLSILVQVYLFSKKDFLPCYSYSRVSVPSFLRRQVKNRTGIGSCRNRIKFTNTKRNKTKQKTKNREREGRRVSGNMYVSDQMFFYGFFLHSYLFKVI